MYLFLAWDSPANAAIKFASVLLPLSCFVFILLFCVKGMCRATALSSLFCPKHSRVYTANSHFFRYASFLRQIKDKFYYCMFDKEVILLCAFITPKTALPWPGCLCCPVIPPVRRAIPPHASLPEPKNSVLFSVSSFFERGNHLSWDGYRRSFKYAPVLTLCLVQTSVRLVK